jgi:hypothetical protein
MDKDPHIRGMAAVAAGVALMAGGGAVAHAAPAPSALKSPTTEQLHAKCFYSEKWMLFGNDDIANKERMLCFRYLGGRLVKREATTTTHYYAERGDTTYTHTDTRVKTVYYTDHGKEILHTSSTALPRPVGNRQAPTPVV